ncbi:MAG: MtrB/PioB family outer membrane beta-barrel protein [Thermoanaerobaculia bacterium]
MRANAFSLILVPVAAALLLVAPATADDSGSGGFHFEIDPLTVSYESVDVDTDSAKFNEYRDLDDGVVLEDLRVFGASADGDRNLRFAATRGGRRDARYSFDYRAEGSWDVEIGLNRIPHRFGNDGLTIFERTGGGRWEIADSTQLALQTAIENQYATNRAGVNYNFLNGLIRPYLAVGNLIDISLQRDRSHAAVDLAKGRDLSWRLAFDHEKRTGTRPYGASFGFSNVTELPEPIDYRTSSGLLRGEWKGKRGGLQFGGRMSSFENNNDIMVWDNPFRFTSATDGSAYSAPGSGSIGGSALGRATLAPDNDALTLFVNGRGKFGAWTMTGSLSWIRMEQDGTLQPYTLNDAIVGVDEHGATFDATNRSFLPQSSADRSVDVLSFSGSAAVRLGDAWKLDLRARRYDYNNNSDRVEFPGYVRFHAVWEEVGRITVPYEYDRTDLSADLGWNLTKRTRLGFVAGLRDMNRAFREIEGSQEVFGRFDGSSHLGGLWLHGHLEYGDRSTDTYHVEAQHDSFTEPEDVNNQPLLRKFDEAERDYVDFLAQADWSLSDVVDLAFGVAGRAEDYNKSRFGLESDDTVRVNAEINWRLGEKGNFYLFANRIDREVVQNSRQSGATPSTNPLDDWSVTFDEKNDVVGVGLTLEPAESWKIDLSGRWSRSDGEADIYSPPGGTPNLGFGFDDYEDIELFAAIVNVDYRINDRFGVGLGWRYEDYVTESFINRGLDYYLPGSLLLNADNGDYQGDVLTLRFHVRY